MPSEAAKPRHLGVLILLVVLGWALAGCGGSNSSPLPGPNPPPPPSPSGTIAEFALGGNFEPAKIIAGTDGNLYLWTGCCPEANIISKVDTAGNVTGLNDVAGLLDIATGSDGNIWLVTSTPSEGLGKMTPAGTLQFFPVNNTGVELSSGPDGNLWVTRINGQALDVYSTAGALLHSFAGPAGAITTGPDQNVWFGASLNTIVKMTTLGTTTSYTFPQMPNGFAAMTAGRDGNLWLCTNDNRIGRLTTSGDLILFSVPTANSQLSSIAAGPDGNVWFTEPGADKIGRITPMGTITEFSIPTHDSGVTSIVAGSDGFMWFVETISLKIGKVHT